NYRPEEIKVSLKSYDLVVQDEHHIKNKNRSEQSSFFKSTTLQPSMQADQ
ncbi:unnamed protein product, partial [Rotaria socialis]